MKTPVENKTPIELKAKWPSEVNYHGSSASPPEITYQQPVEIPQELIEIVTHPNSERGYIFSRIRYNLDHLYKGPTR